MKHFSEHVVLGWLPNLGGLAQIQRPPAPFPGRFPTRVYMRVGKEVRMGKPTANFWQWYACQQRVAGMAHDERPHVAIEFDRNGPVCGYTWDLRTGRNVHFNPHLFNQYHPMYRRNYESMFRWLGTDKYFKEIKGYAARTYTPRELVAVRKRQAEAFVQLKADYGF